MSQVQYKTVSVPMLDTGIGKAAGYESDKALLEAGRRLRERMSPIEREIADMIDRRTDEALLFGSV